MKTVIRHKSNVKFLHLTAQDLEYESRNKPFEQITIRDFNFCINDVITASYVFFVDERNHINWWKKFLGLDFHTNRKVKVLKGENE